MFVHTNDDRPSRALDAQRVCRLRTPPRDERSSQPNTWPERSKARSVGVKQGSEEARISLSTIIEVTTDCRWSRSDRGSEEGRPRFTAYLGFVEGAPYNFPMIGEGFE